MPEALTPHSNADARGFFATTVARPVALLVIFGTLIVIGVLAYQNIPLKLLPSDFQAPSLNIWVPNPNASAQENEEKVTRVLEEELKTLSGIESTWSRSSEGTVFMRVRFNPQIDLDLAKAEVRDRVERARARLPESVNEIGMWSEAADSLPIAWFGLLHGGDSDRTDFLVEKYVIPKLEAVNGISQVDVFGLLQDSVRILLDEEKVRAARLDLGDLIARLSSDNFAQPMGEVDDGGQRFLLRTDMRFADLEEIGDYPVTADLKLRDLGEIRRAKSVRERLARIDGRYAYYGMASKESTANAVEASKGFLAAVAELEKDPMLRGEIQFVPFFVQGDLIENSLDQLKGTALWGGALAIVVLFIFLRRVRLTLCVALSIPVSALLAIAWEYFRGQSFNILTMTGLTLALGMLVDNSVVVIENIARHRALGADGRAAARRGSREIALAITLATLTTVVTFMPLIFMSENPEMRIMFGGIGLPLCMALLFSLLVAVVFLPVVAARVVGDRPRAAESIARVITPVGRGPVRATALVVGLVRLSFYAVIQGLYWSQRALLTLLHPLFLVPAAAAIGYVAFSTIQAGVPAIELASDMPPGSKLGRFDSTDAYASSVAIPALLAILLLLVALPLIRKRRRLSPPARPARFVPEGNSLIEMVTRGNAKLVGWTLKHRFVASVVAFICLLTGFIPIFTIEQGAFMTGDQTDSVRFFVDFDAEFTLAEASDEMRIYEDFVATHRGSLGFEHYATRFDDEDGRIELYWDTPLTRTKVTEARQYIREHLPQVSGHTVRFYDGQDTEKSTQSVAVFTLTGPDSTSLEQYGRQAVDILRNVPGLSNVASPLDKAPPQLELQIDRDLALEAGVPSEAALNTIAWTLRGWSLPRYHEEGREVPLIIEYDQEQAAGVRDPARDAGLVAPGHGPGTALLVCHDPGLPGSPLDLSPQRADHVHGHG